MVTQEGHVTCLDRRTNYRIIKKLIGNRGSVRALTTLVQNGKEFVVTGGCDRHIRVFDPECQLQKVSEVGHLYLKQKINSLLISS